MPALGVIVSHCGWISRSHRYSVVTKKRQTKEHETQEQKPLTSDGMGRDDSSQKKKKAKQTKRAYGARGNLGAYVIMYVCVLEGDITLGPESRTERA
jgi:hypothetical protein